VKWAAPLLIKASASFLCLTSRSLLWLLLAGGMAGLVAARRNLPNRPETAWSG
jgi:hypothetical protein